MVINVLVAWGCTWRSIAYTGATWRQTSLPGPHDWPVAVPAGWPSKASRADIRTTLGTTQDIRIAGESLWVRGSGVLQGHGVEYRVEDYRHGWPRRSLRYGAIWEVEIAPVALGPHFKFIAPSTFIGRLYQGHYPPRWMTPQNSPRFMMPMIPLFPIASGFITNTLIYASVLWLAFAAPRVLRTSRRRRRGQCLACGYELAGLAPGSVCPECGHERVGAR